MKNITSFVTFKRVFFALFFAGLAQAQTGTIVVTSSVVGTAGTGTTAVVCSLTTPALPAIHAVCSTGGTTVLTLDVTPAAGSMNGFVGTYSVSGNSVSWQVQQPTAGQFTWSMNAGSATKSGVFQ